MLETPIPANEKERLLALKSYDIFNFLSKDEFDRITRLAALICETPVSLISLIDENRQWFKSKVGLESSEAPREITFCQHTLMGDGLLEVENTLLDERFKDHPMVTGSPKIRFLYIPGKVYQHSAGKGTRDLRCKTPGQRSIVTKQYDLR